MLAIDPWARTLGFIKGAGETYEKYIAICAGPDGRLHCAPCSASTVLVIHPGTQTLSFIGSIRDEGKKYGGICMGAEGILCCAPFDAASALLVRPFSEELIWDRVATAGGKDFEMLMRAMMP